MALPETYRCEAITLSYTPLGEADLLVTMYNQRPGQGACGGQRGQAVNQQAVGPFGAFDRR